MTPREVNGPQAKALAHRAQNDTAMFESLCYSNTAAIFARHSLCFSVIRRRQTLRLDKRFTPNQSWQASNDTACSRYLLSFWERALRSQEIIKCPAKLLTRLMEGFV